MGGSEYASAECELEDGIDGEFVHPFLPVVIIVGEDFCKLLAIGVEFHLAHELYAELNAEVEASFGESTSESEAKVGAE